MGLFYTIDSKIDRSIGSKISTTNFPFCGVENLSKNDKNNCKFKILVCEIQHRGPLVPTFRFVERSVRKVLFCGRKIQMLPIGFPDTALNAFYLLCQ